jgi:hypothetical protein
MKNEASKLHASLIETFEIQLKHILEASLKAR